MKRRELIKIATLGVGAAWLRTKPLFSAFAATGRFSATDIVTLGRTGIKTSRLACGTGTIGFNHHSNQSALGVQGLADLLWNGYDHGLRFFDAADAYGTHPHVAAALKRIPREKVTILTKSWSRQPDQMRADLDRFRKELNTDYLDIVLMHCVTDDNWPQRFKGVMDVLSAAREKGIIRAHGCSCHSVAALHAAAKTPWAQVVLARVNPIGAHMDADPDTVVSALWEARAAGKGILGMKILGQGDMRHRVDEALKYALSLKVLDAFTVGAESRAEQEDLIRRIAAVSA